MMPLLDLEAGEHRQQGELLAYPDDFKRIVAWYADVCGKSEQYVATSVWRWFTNGRTRVALAGSFANCGKSPSGRSFFGVVVCGPKQGDGPDFDVMAAQPFTVEQRNRLREIIETKLKGPEVQLNATKFWLRIRAAAAGAVPSLPLPSFGQVGYLRKAFRTRQATNDTAGLAHSRYKRVSYATQESEVDSTKLQVFAVSELDAAVRFKNPTMYLFIDAETWYIAACLVSLEAPSNQLFAEILYRAYGGMVDICKEYGLARIAESWVCSRPGRSLWVDNQELTSPQLNEAILVNLGMEVMLAELGQGRDKGAVEGGIGKVKGRVKLLPAAFPKGSVGKILDRARGRADKSVRALEAFVIEEIDDLNSIELPAIKIPKGFPVGERPANRRELFRWQIESNPELVKPVPDKEFVARVCLPTRMCSVHAGEGICVDGRYYFHELLVADGLLKRRAKGQTPRVKIAQHRGTNLFVDWVRGKGERVRCQLHAKQADIVGNMTAAEAQEHMDSMPAARKRELLRQLNKAAHQEEHTDRASAKASSNAAKKGHVTKDMQRTLAAKKAEIARNAKREAHQRFPNDVPNPDVEPTSAAPAPASDADIANRQVDMVQEILRKRAAQSGTGGADDNS
ncbi:hypothetical protein ACG00Y_27695 [Roseateles sp. LYH14W]|uniref:Integrase catalytic domain-containing protein n=2 Tax=Pelomonas parva TaxID=3299032 RepID=A0ABW7FAR1_9BURK